MRSIINFLRNLFYKSEGEAFFEEQVANPETVRQQTKEPQHTRIESEAVFGMKDGYLVVMIDHKFQDIPSWVEWDASTKMVNIAHQSGDTDEVHADIKPEHIDALVDMKKVLLVSNDNDKKIVHYLPFLARR